MIKLIDLEKLKIHEKGSHSRLEEVKRMIISACAFTEPIIVEKDHLVILDGHHRVTALKQMGYRRIPAYLVDYFKQNVRVNSRRSNYRVSKDLVISRAVSGQPYPSKTSRHFIPQRPKNFKIALSKLK